MSEEREFKDRVYRQLARVGKSVSSPRRIELLDLLTQAPHSVAELAEATDMSVANTSQHLQTLREARLVETERDGNQVIYHVASEEVAAFFVHLRNLAEDRLAELDAAATEYFADSPGGEVDAQEIWSGIEEGELTVVDVRPEDEYESGHIEGAISIPIDEFEEHVDRLQDDEQVVVYCRGPYCTMAADAVETLDRHGVEAVRLREGYPDWRLQKRDSEA